MKSTYRRCIILYSCLFCLQFTSINAQSFLRGKVVDMVSRQPLVYVSVFNINSPAAKAVTNQYGDFIITSNTDSFSLQVSYIGYKSVLINAVKNTAIKIELQQDVVDLKDIVVLQNSIATKFNTLSKIDLDLKPVRSTQELLSIVPGLFIAQHAGGGKAEQIFLRGFDCDHGTDVQVSVDGMPVNMVSHAHGQGYADAHFIIPETVNNIDFGAGPYYTQHGNLNTAGYVSFGTFKNIANSRIQVEAGRYNTFRTLAMIDLLKKNKDKQSAYVAADLYYTNGPTQNKQHFKRFNIFGKYNLAISENTQLTASLSSFKSKWDASGQVPERAVESLMINRFGSVDPTEGGNTERHNANIILNHIFNNGSSWENQLFYNRYKFNLYSNFTFFLNDPVQGDQINQAESRAIFGYSSKINKQYSFNNWQLRSIYGAGVRYDATNDSKLTHVVKRAFLDNIKSGDIKEVNAYGYVHQQLSKGRWLMDAGVRFDYFHFNYFDKLSVAQNPSQQKTITSPKVNIQYTINSDVQLFVKSGKGFHSNDARVVTANSGKQILPAAYGSDFGIILKPAKKIFLSAAFWYLYLEQEFVYVGDDGNVELSGKTRREGIDVIARYQFSKKLFVNVNINFTQSRAIGEDKGNDYIPLAPTITSTGGVFYKAANGFNGSLTYRYIKDRPANENNSIVAKGYLILDASFNYTKPEYEIGLSVENMLNKKWNEAQFATTSRLRDEPIAVAELNFTPGTPLFARLKLAVFF